MNHALRLVIPLVALAVLLSGCTMAPEETAEDNTTVPIVPTPGAAPVTPEESTGIGAPATTDNDTAPMANATPGPGPTPTTAEGANATLGGNATGGNGGNATAGANATAGGNATTGAPANETGAAAPAPVAPPNATVGAPAAGAGDTTAGGAPVAGGNATPPGAAPGERWPQEGSYVRYEVKRVGLTRGTPVATSANVTLAFQGGEWRGQCVTDRGAAERIERYSRGGSSLRVRASDAERLETLEMPPLVVQERNDRARGFVLDGCDRKRVSLRVLDDGDDPRRQDEEERLRDARSSVAAARSGRGGDVEWDPESGLVLSWTLPSRNRIVSGELVATDAPGVDVGPAANATAPSGMPGGAPAQPAAPGQPMPMQPMPMQPMPMQPMPMQPMPMAPTTPQPGAGPAPSGAPSYP